jgi:hypothetical protein
VRPICRELAPPYGEAHVADRFPARCPDTLDQVLGDFWPEPRSGQERSS